MFVLPTSMSLFYYYIEIVLTLPRHPVFPAFTTASVTCVFPDNDAANVAQCKCILKPGSSNHSSKYRPYYVGK